MKGTGNVRLAGLAVAFAASVLSWGSARGGEAATGSVYGGLHWTGFIEDLEDLYRPGAGWSIGYDHPVAASWSIAAEVGARYHEDRAAHRDGAHGDPGLRGTDLFERGAAGSLRILPWIAQARWTVPWDRLGDEADLILGAGFGGYTVRWDWREPDRTRSKSYFGINGGAHFAWRRSDAVDLLFGGTYHAISTDDLFDEDDFYHVLELKLGVAFHLAQGTGR